MFISFSVWLVHFFQLNFTKNKVTSIFYTVVVLTLTFKSAIFIFTECKFYKSLCMVLKSPPELGYVTTWLSPLPQSVLGHWQVVSGLIINVIIINLVCYSLDVYDKWMINKIWSISVSTVTDNNLRENYETKYWCWLKPLSTLIIH